MVVRGEGGGGGRRQGSGLRQHRRDLGRYLAHGLGATQRARLDVLGEGPMRAGLENKS